MEQSHFTKPTAAADEDNTDDYSDNTEKDTKFPYTVEEKKLLRKINTTTLPFIFMIILLQVHAMYN